MSMASKATQHNLIVPFTVVLLGIIVLAHNESCPYQVNTHGYNGSIVLLASGYKASSIYKADHGMCFWYKESNTSIKRTTMLYICLLMCGDIQTNPGPIGIKYPCVVCHREVRDKDPALQCDECNVWTHINCDGTSLKEYKRFMKHKWLSWECWKCRHVNLSDSFFDEQTLELNNSFDVLSDDQLTPSSQDEEEDHPLPPASHQRTRTLRPKRLKVMQLNCNGLKGQKKRQDFSAAVEHHKPDIIIGCESKLDSTIPTYSVFSDDYNVLRKDRNANGGGVFLAFKNDIAVVEKPEINLALAEIIWASVQFKGGTTLYIGSYYRPPNASNDALDQLHDSINGIFSKHTKRVPNVILGGDFNLPDIDWNSTTTSSPRTQSLHNSFIELLNYFNLTQVVKHITRPTSGNVLDLTLTSNDELIGDVQTASGISDHSILVYSISLPPKLERKSSRKIYKYDKANKTEVQKCITEATEKYFEDNPNERTVEENWNFFKSTIDSVMRQIPSKTWNGKPSHPYVSRSIIQQMRKRDKLYGKAIRERTDETWESYKKKRREVQKSLRKSHHDYMNNVIGDSLKTDGKKFWTYVKNQKRDSVGIPTLKKDETLYFTSDQKADALNRQFSSVFTQDDANPLPCMGPCPYTPIADLEIGLNGIVKQLKQLKANKASGPDEITSRVLKEYAEDLSPILTHLFQQSYHTGILPRDWKRARVAGIYKSGVKSDPANYRPISLTCICCKVMEHVVLSHVSKHLADNDVLIDKQHGFREKLSCETQLVEAVDDWSQAINEKRQTDVLFLDFSKAFDRVSHRKLLHKLTYYGIQGNTHHWISAFLTGRSQQVSVNGSASPPSSVLSGVPQGSVLGPMLFLLYVNDITTNVNSSMRLFADDSVIYRTICGPDDQERLQEDLQKVFQWAETWSMAFNISKCAHLSITLKRRPYLFNYSVNEQVLPQKKTYKYLGVTVRDDLRWNTHVEALRSKASRTMGILRRNLGSCSKKVRETAYKTLVRPQLEYSSCAWNPHKRRNTNLLEGIQRQAARFVTQDFRRTSSVSDMISLLAWNTLEQRRIFAQCGMFFKIHKNMVNIPLTPGIHPVLHQRELRGHTTHPFIFHQLPCRVDCYKYSFFPRVIPIWNRLPAVAVTSSSIAGFQTSAVPSIIAMMGMPTRAL